MSKRFFLQQAHRWLNLPTSVLIALLQRSPVLRVLSSAAEYVAASPASSILKAAFAGGVALGAVDTLAGATSLSSTKSGPLTVAAGDTVSVAFNIDGTETAPASWSISGNVPSGTAFYTAATAPGTGVTSGAINTANGQAGTIYLVGHPTIAGSYTINLRAWLGQDGTTGGMLNGASKIFSYMVIVTGPPAPSPTPTPTPAGAGPVITSDPVSQTLPIGSNVTFSATATGIGLTYQWWKDGSMVSGATSAGLTMNNIQPANAGVYAVVVTNGTSGSSTSRGATLTVATPLPGRLINLSVRTNAGTGAQTLIAGFIISGNGTKSVMVRGTGPTLANFQVPGFLTDPRLDLFNQDKVVIASNDSWGAAANLAAIQAVHGDAFGAFTLDAKDAIVLTPLTVAGASGYTAQLVSSNNGTGVALVEVYDEDAGNPGDAAFAAQPKLTNLSARTQVGTGANILIAGFIINGNVPKKVMIRAIGPTLATLGVSGVLADPQLQIIDGSKAVVAQNDNWGSASNVAEIMAANGNVIATSPPTTLDAKDAVLVLTLLPGSYTAQVSGVNNGTGVALIEVYDLQ